MQATGIRYALRTAAGNEKITIAQGAAKKIEFVQYNWSKAMKIRKVGKAVIVGSSIFGIIFLFFGVIAVSSSDKPSTDVFQFPAGVLFIILGILNFYYLTKGIIRGNKAASLRIKNEIIIQRPAFEAGSAIDMEVYIDDCFYFTMSNTEEKILKIENGKHVIKVLWDDAHAEKEFEIQNDGKLFALRAGRPPAIKER